MNFSNSFKFHRFNDIEINNTLEMPKYLLNKDDNKRSKTIKENDDLNLSKNLTNKSLKLLPLATLLKSENENENDMIYENNNNSPFPLKALINADFEKLVKNGQIPKINSFLPQIISQDINSEEIEIKPDVKLVLTKYQQILRYLFNMEKKMGVLNNKLEKSTDEIINPKEKISNKEKKLDKKIEDNEDKIFCLENRINIYKEIILFNKRPQKSLSNFILDIHDENYNYYCDICPNIKFNSYKEVQIHYLEEHKHILKIREANHNKNLMEIQVNNNNYEKFYFDTTLDLIKDEIKYLLVETNLKKAQDYNYNNNSQDEKNSKLRTIQINNNKISSKTLNNEAFEDKINQNMDLDEIDEKFNNFDNMNEKLLNSFEAFKKEVITNLQNIQNNKPVDFTSNNINYFNENKNSLKYSQNNFNLGERYDDGNDENEENDYTNYNKKINIINENKIEDENVKNFIKTFNEREKNILNNKNIKIEDLADNYNIHINNQNKNRFSRKVNEMIDNKYKEINDKNMDKEELKEFINNIYNQNEYIMKKNHLGKYYDNLLTIFDLKSLKNNNI